MTMDLAVSSEVQHRLEAEAARRQITVAALVSELADALPASDPSENDALQRFFGSGDSGDPRWASTDLKELRRDLAERRSGVVE
jgi:hypothetical protein